MTDGNACGGGREGSSSAWEKASVGGYEGRRYHMGPRSGSGVAGTGNEAAEVDEG